MMVEVRIARPRVAMSAVEENMFPELWGWVCEMDLLFWSWEAG